MSLLLQVKVSADNSAGTSFRWNYATDTFYSNYAGANVYCNMHEVLLQLCTLRPTYVCGSFCCIYEGECFCWNYAVRSFCKTYTNVGFCRGKHAGDNF